MRLLYIEDDLDQQLLLIRLLRDHEVKAVRHPSDALNIAQHFEPHAILIDIHLPEMNGFALVEHLRSLPQTAQTFIVALTADHTHTGHDYLQAGFDAYLLKPFSRQHLIELLKDAEAPSID